MSLRSQKLGVSVLPLPRSSFRAALALILRRFPHNLDEACWGFMRQPLNNNKTVITERSFTRCYHLPRLHFLLQILPAAAFCSSATSAALLAMARVSLVAEGSPPCLGAKLEEHQQQGEKSQGSAPAQAREALEGGCLVGC